VRSGVEYASLVMHAHPVSGALLTLAVFAWQWWMRTRKPHG
jgi:hypothetical protein